MHRTLIDACRTIMVWGVDLIVYYAFDKVRIVTISVSNVIIISFMVELWSKQGNLRLVSIYNGTSVARTLMARLPKLFRTRP